MISLSLAAHKQKQGEPSAEGEAERMIEEERDGLASVEAIWVAWFAAGCAGDYR